MHQQSDIQSERSSPGLPSDGPCNLRDGTLLHYARLYASRGWSIIPLRGKRPAIDAWREFQHSGPDTALLPRWFASPRVNIGIVTGRVSDLVVVDCDSTEDATFWKERFPRTPLAAQLAEAACITIIDIGRVMNSAIAFDSWVGVSTCGPKAAMSSRHHLVTTVEEYTNGKSMAPSPSKRYRIFRLNGSSTVAPDEAPAALVDRFLSRQATSELFARCPVSAAITQPFARFVFFEMPD